VPATNVPIHFGSPRGIDSLTVWQRNAARIITAVVACSSTSEDQPDLDDSADTTARTIDHDLDSVRSTFLGQFTGIAPGTGAVRRGGVNSVTLRPGAATDTINVNETGSEHAADDPQLRRP
jgi:hypothetical protein